jgi:molybdopterin/thiamine biosynthesis adenylyltransferase/rhodanese-related sulfurtransferase
MKSHFLRYSCQMALPQFGETKQKLLQNAKVLIVGAGGLGCPAAQYLTASGVGTIAIADFDTISISNLHRQVLYSAVDVGLKKAEVACKKLQQQNPLVTLIPLDVKITSMNVMEIVHKYDIVADGTDNFDTKYLLNDACVLAGKPLVYGAIYQYEGQVAIWNVLNEDGTGSFNYRDIFPKVDADQIPNCAEGGVIPTLAGIIGCMQANEIIKYITKTGNLLAGKILIFDALSMQSRIINFHGATKTNIMSLTENIDIPTISAFDLKKNLRSDLYELIDVRDLRERKVFNIGGKHIPLDKLETDTSYLKSNKEIIFYCTTGKRSAQAVKQIKKRFPDSNIYSLDGGLKAWQEIN